MGQGRVTFDLTGNNWKMIKARPGVGVQEGFQDLPAEFQGAYYSWNQATVPGDVYTDLYRAGELDDPCYGRNMHRAKWVQEYEWWYTTRFIPPDELWPIGVSWGYHGADLDILNILNDDLAGGG